MRKLLLIATLSIGTLACAQLAGNNMISEEQPGNDSSYSHKLAAQVQEYKLDNAAIAPSASQFMQDQALNVEEPSSMAANEGMQGGQDWYNQRIAAQAELNRRLKRAETENKF
jgi:hypothetical protein